MGTITIEEYASIGGQGAVDGSPVANLSGCIKTTVDATTSTSAENITLDPNTRYVVISSVEKHRASVKDSSVTDRYGEIPANGTRDYAVNETDKTLYYRLDA